MTARILRIAKCTGFHGDRLSAAREIVDDGAVDVPTGACLAKGTKVVDIPEEPLR